MLNFELYNPTKIIFGKDQLEKLSNEIPPNARILMVYGGGSIFRNGIYDNVKSALQGFEITEFGGVEANPYYETLIKAIDIIKKEKIDFVLAVGGGSVIDGVKFIVSAALYEGDPLDIFYRKHRPIKALPFGTVLTLPATGSEMNSGSVISRKETQEKMSFGSEATFPKFSFCDPTVITSLPERQIQNGVMDAFSHVLEQYLTYKHDAILQDKIAESILKTLVEIGPKVIANPNDYALASNFMWSCTMALNGLIAKGVPTDWVTHMIGHELTALYGIDHARTLAIIFPSLYSRSEEHTSELQSRPHLVCRLLLEKKNRRINCSHVRTSNATGCGFLTASTQFRHGATSKSRSTTDSNSPNPHSPHFSG